MTGFTKGPWTSEVGTSTGMAVKANHEPKVRRNVASCGGMNREANAHLIAAAPDLYEASEPFENIAEEEDTAGLREETPVTVIIGERVHDFTLKLGDLRAIQKALAKARGETQA